MARSGFLDVDEMANMAPVVSDVATVLPVKVIWASLPSSPVADAISSALPGLRGSTVENTLPVL